MHRFRLDAVPGRPRRPLVGAALRRSLVAAAAAAALSLAAVPAAMAVPATGGAAAAEEAPRRVPAVLERIAQCESGGDPAAVSADGRHRGKYQFSRETWRGLGGAGDPAAAPEVVQDGLALELFRQRGIDPWPVCGRAAARKPVERL